MFFKHVTRTFARQWLTVLMLGVLLVVSGFIYSVMSLSVSALKEASDSFFVETNQEDFSLTTRFHITAQDLESDLGCSPEVQTPLVTLYHEDFACYEAVIESRRNMIEAAYQNIRVEPRFYKDTYIMVHDARHRSRILKDMNEMNLSMIEAGEYPESGEVAISRLYAQLNNLSIDDELMIGSETFLISGFVLFPDYNLPIFEHLYMFDSANQTFILMADSDFESFDATEHVEFAGIFDGEYDALAFETEMFSLLFVEQVVLTENNPRSGAIYAELDGSQALGLFLSIMIAVIGMIIVGVMVSKTMSEEKRTLGVFKALGVKPIEMVFPYLVAVFSFAVVALSIGYLFGFLLAPLMQSLYLRFYLLPEAEIGFLASNALIAIVLPTVIVVSLTFWRLYRMVHPSPILLIEPKMFKVKPVKAIWFKKLLSKFDILSVLQGSILIRQWAKVSVYVIGVFLGLYLAFLSLGMRDVFNRTMHGYYGEHFYESTVYCDFSDDCDSAGHEKGIEISVFANEQRATLVGLDADSEWYVLRNRAGESVVPKVSEGIVISRSFSDLTGLDVGDDIEIQAFGETMTLEVSAIAHVYPGEKIYYDRAVMSLLVTGDDQFFNRLYTESRVESMGSALIVHRTEMIEQLDDLNVWYQIMIYIMVASSLTIAVIIIYLLSILTVESKYYELSLFKVLGFNNKEISGVLLGGYMKINVVVFVVVIPVVFVSFTVLTRMLVAMFGIYFPLSIGFWDILFAGVLFGVVSLIGTTHAKYVVKKRSLQEALKIYQV